MAIAWSPDSAYIVSGSIDTNIIVWNAATGDRDEMRGNAACSIVANDFSSLMSSDYRGTPFVYSDWSGVGVKHCLCLLWP